MISTNAGLIRVEGAMTLTQAKALLDQGVAALAAGEGVVDMAQVTEVDSSALAVVFGWMRAAQARGMQLRLDNLPPEMLSLAEVYGVRDLLPVA
ncbi:MAG: STAS domain-containing protein [Proteobacteria bacterium]|nr:STAS domain-containing protein [Pseudomonadota bacterium]HQR03728.1 STAS domain-containing protein [Rhodocyclaceae bacterium]